LLLAITLSVTENRIASSEVRAESVDSKLAVARAASGVNAGNERRLALLAKISFDYAITAITTELLIRQVNVNNASIDD